MSDWKSGDRMSYRKVMVTASENRTQAFFDFSLGKGAGNLLYKLSVLVKEERRNTPDAKL